MLTKEQAHRLLEAIQRNALALNAVKVTLNLAEEENKELGNALMGMMNGNLLKSEKPESS